MNFNEISTSSYDNTTETFHGENISHPPFIVFILMAVIIILGLTGILMLKYYKSRKNSLNETKPGASHVGHQNRVVTTPSSDSQGLEDEVYIVINEDITGKVEENPLYVNSDFLKKEY